MSKDLTEDCIKILEISDNQELIKIKEFIDGDDNYYQPKITDFIIGLDYQMFSVEDQKWKDCHIFDAKNLLYLESVYNNQKWLFRIKYLSDIDILIGLWIPSSQKCPINKNGFEIRLPSNDYKLWMTFNKEQSIIYKIINSSLSRNIIFCGKIKNRLELIKITNDILGI